MHGGGVARGQEAAPRSLLDETLEAFFLEQQKAGRPAPREPWTTADDARVQELLRPVSTTKEEYLEASVSSSKVIGSTDKIGGYPASNPHSPEDMAATIYNQLGIPHTAAWHDETGRPRQAR